MAKIYISNQKTEMVTNKQGRMVKLVRLMLKIVIIALTSVIASSLITLTMLMVSDRAKSLTRYLSIKLPVNASHIHFYSKKDEDPTNINVDTLCQNGETHSIVEISVWKTPLHAIERLPFDGDVAWHAYIVTETEDPMGVRHYWSQEKLRDRLVLQHSTDLEDVVTMINGEERIGEKAWQAHPELLLRDSSALGAVPQYYILS